MWISLVLLVLAAAAYFYLQKKKQKQDREILQPPPLVDLGMPIRPTGKREITRRQIQSAKDKPVKVAVKQKPPAVNKQPPKTKPPAAVKNPVKQAPVKKTPKPAPKGWFRNGAGHLLRNTNQTALWNFDVARTTKRIDFALMDGGLLSEQDLGNVNLDRLAYNAFPLPDVNFTVDSAQDARFNTAVIYLCDKSGKVIDFTISSEGRTLDEKSIAYINGDLKDGPYIVQASNGLSAGSTFRRIRSRRAGPKT